MSDKTELLPCPFCGNEELTSEPESTYIMCHGCDADGPVTAPGKAGKAWNTRATHAEDVRAVVDELVYMYRRKGFDSWASCDRDRFDLLSDHNCFEVDTLYRHSQSPVVVPEKYDDVVLPFLALMRAELHANAHKGDRPGWLSMDRKTAVLEVFYHIGKLHQAVHRDEAAAICEYAADVANMCMMLTDVCGCLDEFARLNTEISR